MDRPIDFFVIGSQRAGTTSLYESLAQHPEIFLPAVKDFFAFLDDPVHGISDEELPLYFEEYQGERLIGACNVRVILYPDAIARLHRHNPDMKLVVMARNPVERAYSGYWMARRMGREPLKSFDQAIEQSLAGTKRGNMLREQSDLSYLDYGCYYDRLVEVYRLFDRSRVFVGLLEDLKSEPQKFLHRLLLWLGVDTGFAEEHEMVRNNAASRPRLRILQTILSNPPAWVVQALHRALPHEMVVRISETVLRLREKNQKRIQYPPMSDETRARLVEYFAPHTEKLGQMIGRDLSHWR